jgi:hypothetical protein
MRFMVLIAALGLTAAAEPPGAPISPRPPDTPPEQGANVLRPLKGVRFLHLPSSKDLLEAWPVRESWAPTPEGRVELGCTVGHAGWLRDCVVVREVPLGYGLGEAALKLEPKFRVAARNDRGLPTAGRYLQVPVIFRNGG